MLNNITILERNRKANLNVILNKKTFDDIFFCQDEVLLLYIKTV